MRQQWSHWLKCGVLGIGTCCVSGLVYADDPQTAVEEEKVIVIVNTDDDDGAEQKEERIIVRAGNRPKVWLGVLLKEVEGDLARYLGTEEGILIDKVVDDSPAESAGVAPGDVLVNVNGEGVDEPKQLLDILTGVEEGDALSLTLLRKGKTVEVAVKPVERPSDPQEAHAEASIDLKVDLENLAELGDVEGLHEALQEMHLQGRWLDSDMNVYKLGGPAFTWRGGGDHGHVNMKIIRDVDGDKMEVTVERKGDEDAKITVQHGDQDPKTYSEEQIDDLPEEISETVKNALKQHAGNRFQLKVLPNVQALEAIKESGIQKDVAERLRGIAERASAQAAEASQRIRARVTTDAEAANKEVVELRALVDELKQEVQALKKQLKDD